MKKPEVENLVALSLKVTGTVSSACLDVFLLSYYCERTIILAWRIKSVDK